MARKLAQRLCIEATVKAVQPLHVGGYGDTLETDMPLAENGRGEIYLPGTSLAGMLRAWMDRHIAGSSAWLKQLWGDQTGASDDCASRLVVSDAPITLPPGLMVERWDGVGIDRQWGTAATGIKFDRVVLPRGATFTLRLSVDLPDQAQDANRIRAGLGHLLAALQSGQLHLGAATTRGLGQITLDSSPLNIREQDWSSRAGVLAVLGASNQSSPGKLLTIQNLKDADPACQVDPMDWLDIVIDWQPVGPLMVKAGTDGMAVDMLPMVSGKDGKLTLVLPGSGVKGALRFQAERIVRTVRGHTALAWDQPDNDSERKRLGIQLALELVEPLFGGGKRRSCTGAQQETGRGALAVATCYANTTFTPQQWRNIAGAPAETDGTTAETQLYQALRAANLRGNAGGPDVQQAYHVAVDRWTGGAAESLLYSALEPLGLQWEPLHLRLDLGRLSSRYPALAKPAVALLLLVLRDLNAKRIPLGFGGNRGYGEVNVRNIRFTGPQTTEWAWLDKVSLADLPVQKNVSLKDLEIEWQKWINLPQGSSS